MPSWSPTRFAVLRWGLLILVSLSLHGCFFAQVKQRTSSYGPSPESVDLLGPRRTSRDAPSGQPTAIRVAAIGQGVTIQGHDSGDGGSPAVFAGGPAAPVGRFVPAGSFKLMVAFEPNPYFEIGLIGGAACGKVAIDGNPRDVDASCLPTVSVESRGIFGSDRLQTSVHLRLGFSAVSAMWDYEVATDDGDAIGSSSEELDLVLTASTALSIAYRITPRVSFVAGLTVDAVPFVRSRDSRRLDCDSLTSCKREAGKLHVVRDLAVIPALGVEVALSDSIRLRTLVTPATFNGPDSPLSFLGLSGALEWGVARSRPAAPATPGDTGAPK